MSKTPVLTLFFAGVAFEILLFSVSYDFIRTVRCKTEEVWFDKINPDLYRPSNCRLGSHGCSSAEEMRKRDDDERCEQTLRNSSERTFTVTVIDENRGEGKLTIKRGMKSTRAVTLCHGRW